MLLLAPYGRSAAIMQTFTMRYNLEFRKLTFCGLTRPQSIRKSKQISGQTILRSPQDLEFNLIFRKIATFQWLKNSVTRPVTPVVLMTDTLLTISTLITCQIPAYNLYYIFQYTYVIHFCLDTIFQNCPKVGFFERRRQDVNDRAPSENRL